MSDRTGRTRLPAGLLFGIALLRLPSLLVDYPIGSADETVWIFEGVERMIQGDLNPHHFEYPAGVVFTCAWALGKLVYLVGHLFGQFPDLQAFSGAMHRNCWGFTVLFRLPTFSLSLLGVVALYRLGCRISSKASALSASVAFGLAMPYVEATRMHFTDLAAVTLLIFAIDQALDVLEGDARSSRLVMLGATLGSMVNLKLPYLLCLIVLPMVALLSSSTDQMFRDPHRRASRGLSVALTLGGSALVALACSFTISPEQVVRHPQSATSLIFLQRNLLLAGASWVLVGFLAFSVPAVRAFVNFLLQARTTKIPVLAAVVTFFLWSPFYLADAQATLAHLMIVARGFDAESIGPRPFTFHLVILQRACVELLGPVLGGLGILGCLVAIRRRDRRDLVVLTAPALWFVYVGFANYSKLNMMYIFTPFLALYASILINEMPRAVAVAVLVIGLLIPLVVDIRRVNEILGAPRRDTRQELAAWYVEVHPRGIKIAQDPDLFLIDAQNSSIYQVPLPRRDFNKLIAEGTRLVIVSSWTLSKFHISEADEATFQRELRKRCHLVSSWVPIRGVIGGPSIQVWEPNAEVMK